MRRPGDPGPEEPGPDDARPGDARQDDSRPNDARPGRDLVDRADYDPDYDPDAPVPCEVCGATMVYTASCKLRCPACGYTRDCSDP